MNQLIHLVHNIYQTLDNGKEVRIVFLDISKAFDKVWHAGLLSKLEAIGVKGRLLEWIKSYLHGREQRVVIEGYCSDWKEISAGVPQGSVLGPLLFLIYINDIVSGLSCHPYLYADVTTLFETVSNRSDSTDRLNSDLSAMKAKDNEQYSRRHNIRIVGFPEEKDENCAEKVTKFGKETLQLPISSTDIDRAHRVGKPSHEHRAIIVRLQSHRHKIMKTRRSLKGTNVFINEDLTKGNQQLFSEARKLTNVKLAWTRDGRIFVKHRDNERIHRIDSRFDFIKYNLSADAYYDMPEQY